ncbi:MAG: hypothetical protein JWP80_4587 [Pseudomonas sp.]|nr:hypothetical protein [Pseudomonas sp.]
MPGFYLYFKENMESLGLPAPETLFGSVTSAVATATTILSQVDKFGKSVTIGELIVAGARLEKLAMVGACSAAFYAGAVIGSIAVAIGRTWSGGTSLADVLFTASRYNLNREWLSTCLFSCPGIYVKNERFKQFHRHYRLPA